MGGIGGSTERIMAEIQSSEELELTIRRVKQDDVVVVQSHDREKDDVVVDRQLCDLYANDACHRERSGPFLHGGAPIEVVKSDVDVHAGNVEIMVCNIGGSSSTVRTRLSNSVVDFKDELERQGALLYSARQTELILGSDVLQDVQVLGDLCLQDGAMITALIKLEKLLDKNEVMYGDNPHSRVKNALRGEAIL